MDTPIRLTRAEGSEPEDFHLSRRGIAAAGLFFFGYALSTGPVNAQAITTTADGLMTKNLTIPPLHDEGGYQIPAYVAAPVTPGKHPVIIVVSEVFGLHEYIRDICRRLAHQGYTALAIDYFARKGNAAAITDFKLLMPLVATATYPQVMGDLQAQVDWLKTQPYADMDRVGITGFCWGGTPVWMAAETMPVIKAGVAWYGRLEKPTDGLGAGENRPWPIDGAGKLTKPVLGLYADNDPGNPLDEVQRMNDALKASGKTPSHIIVMPNTKHAFFADYRPSYQPEAAKAGWADLLDWFKKYV